MKWWPMCRRCETWICSNCRVWLRPLTGPMRRLRLMRWHLIRKWWVDTLGVLLKYQDDIARIEGSAAQGPCVCVWHPAHHITRQLRFRDVDQALEKVAETVEDWSGGTRIGAFNRDWPRRVLGQGIAVILVSDGLERVTDVVLMAEAARLHRSCARLVWLNPLLRYDGFEPRASGIKTLIGHVDGIQAGAQSGINRSTCDGAVGADARFSENRRNGRVW